MWFLNFVQLRTQRFSSQQGMPTRDPIGLPWKHANCRYFLGQREASAWLCSGIPMLSHRGPIVLNLSSSVLLISCKISYISQCNRNPQTFLPSTQDCCLVPNSNFCCEGDLHCLGSCGSCHAALKKLPRNLLEVPVYSFSKAPYILAYRCSLVQLSDIFRHFNDWSTYFKDDGRLALASKLISFFLRLRNTPGRIAPHGAGNKYR